MNEAKAQEPWITKNKINFAFKKFCEKKKLEETEVSKSVATINMPCTGGRPKGSTIENQYHHKETLAAEKNEIYALYQNKKNEQKTSGKRVVKGWLKETIERVCESRGLPPSTAISVKSIRKRMKPVILTEQGRETLMHEVAPQLVTLSLAMAQACRCL